MVERQKRIIMGMVRSTISTSHLREYLSHEALKIAVYILNRVPSKSIHKTSFKLWTGRIRGCPTELKYIFQK